jgi:pimeloyl-ACP methyl ester carboxylesterase
MPETTLELPDGSLFLRHTVLEKRRATLFFVHGLGESGLCFSEAFEAGRLPGFNLVAPDLLGYGRSSRASNEDYRFDSHVRRLWKVVDELGVQSLCVIGHSLGGDLATLMATSQEGNRIQGLVNVEGNLTPDDAFISRRVVAAEERGDFLRWFREDFMEGLVSKKWGKKWPSCRRYYASLELCRPEAFLANADEARARSLPLPGRRESSIGAVFAELEIQKVFCWGAESLSEKTRQFLQAAKIPDHRIDRAFHWPMIDQPDEFYAVVREFAERVGRP